jgi:hypothetical protein
MTTSPPQSGELSWTVWPAQQRPPHAAAVLALILGVSWYGYAGFGSIAYSIIALVVLTFSLSFFLFPSTYTLDAAGIELRGFLHTKRKAWEELGCYLRADDFIAVSVSPEPTEQSIRQGFVLRLAYNGDEVAQVLERHLPAWTAPAESGKPHE